MTIGGLMVGVVAAGLLLLLLQYVIHPTMSVETYGIYKVPGERFNVWYHDDSSRRDEHADLSARLEESLDDLLARLDVDPSDVPVPIDVVVHDDPGQMQSNIAQRKSLMTTHTFFSMIDLLGGEDPYPRLTELVLAFGWGECFSQLLYSGTLAVLTAPERNHHCAVAAAPERLRYSVDDLLMLELVGEFPETLYQQFDSPFSVCMLGGSLASIAMFYKYFGEDENFDSQQHAIPLLQAASLVQYLIDSSGGLGALRLVWGPGTSLSLIERFAGKPVDELDAAWMGEAIRRGSEGVTYDYYRAVYLFETGAFSEAYELTKAWAEDGRELTDEDDMLRARYALSVGAFDEAATWAGADSVTNDRLAGWIDLFHGWNRVERDGIVVLGDYSDEELVGVLERTREMRGRIATELEIGLDMLPGPMTLFYYKDAATRHAGEGLTPSDNAQRGAWHLVEGEDVAWILAATLPAYVFRVDTASTVLRTGLATAVTVASEELIAQGCDLLSAGDWMPLRQLGFGDVSSQPAQVQSGLLIHYLIEAHGWETVRRVWEATAKLGGSMSLESALRELTEMSKQDIEQVLLDSVLVCD